MREVTDPALLARLNSGDGAPEGLKEVTDPDLLSQLNYTPGDLANAPDIGFTGGLAASLGKAASGLMQRSSEGDILNAEKPTSITNQKTGSTFADLYNKILPIIRPDLATELSHTTPEDVRAAAGNVGVKLDTLLHGKNQGIATGAGQVTADIAPYLAAPGGAIIGSAVAGAASNYLQPTQNLTAQQSSGQALTSALYGATEGAATGAAFKTLTPIVRMAGSAIYQGGKAIINPSAALNSSVEKRVGNELLNRATDPQSLFKEAPEDTPNIPGQTYTVGELSGDQGLLKLQRKLGSTVEGADAASARAMAGKDAINQQVALLAPQDTDAATRAALMDRQKQGLDFAQNIENKGAANYKQAITPILSGTSPEDASTVLDMHLRNTIGDATNQKNNIYQSIDPSRSAEVDTSDLRKTLQDITTPKGPLDLTPSKLPSDIISKLQDHLSEDANPTPTTATVGGQTFTVNPAIQAQIEAAGGGKVAPKLTIADLQDLRPTISTAISKAKANYEGDTVTALTKLKTSIDSTVQGFGAQGGQSAAALRAQEANTHFNTDFAPKYREGAVGAFEKANRTNSTPPTATMDRFFKSGAGARESINDLVNVTKNNPEATQAIHDFALGKAVKDAGNNPEKLQNWVDKYGEAINGVPGLKDKFDNLSDASFELQRYQAKAAALRKGLSSPRDSVIASYLDKDNATDSMGKILSSSSKNRDAALLMNSLQGNKVAIQGAQRALVSHFTDAAGDIAKTPKALGEFYNKNLPVFQQLYRNEPEQLNRIKDIVKSLDLTSQESRVGLVGSDTAFKKTPFVKSIVGKLASKFTGEAIGAGAGELIGGHLGAVGGTIVGKQLQEIFNSVSQEKFNKLISEAIYNPDVARTLVMKVNDGNAAVAARKMKLILNNLTPLVAKGVAAENLQK